MAHRIGPWHDWFAWHPVHTDYYGWRWLRTLRRRRRLTGYTAGDSFAVEWADWQYTLPGAEGT